MHVIYATRVSLYMMQYRSQSEHLISSIFSWPADRLRHVRGGVGMGGRWFLQKEEGYNTWQDITYLEGLHLQEAEWKKPLRPTTQNERAGWMPL